MRKRVLKTRGIDGYRSRWQAEEEETRSPGRLTKSMTSLLKLIPALVGVAVLAQALPAYYRHNEFDSYLKHQARSSMTPQDLKQDLLTKAGEYSLPLKENDIDVQTVERTFRVAVDYTVPIDLVLFRQNLKFHSLASGFLPK